MKAIERFFHRQDEKQMRFLLRLEWVFLLIGTTLFLALYIPAAVMLDNGAPNMPLAITMIVLAFLILIVAVVICLLIEQYAGVYECRRCMHHHIPSFTAMLLSPHIGRTRYMRCPHCGEKSWQKKILR